MRREGDHHIGFDQKPELRLVEERDLPGDDALLLEPLKAAGALRGREMHLLPQLLMRERGVLLQQGKQPPVGLVHCTKAAPFF